MPRISRQDLMIGPVSRRGALLTPDPGTIVQPVGHLSGSENDASVRLAVIAPSVQRIEISILQPRVTMPCHTRVPPLPGKRRDSRRGMPSRRSPDVTAFQSGASTGVRTPPAYPLCDKVATRHSCSLGKLRCRGCLITGEIQPEWSWHAQSSSSARIPTSEPTCPGDRSHDVVPGLRRSRRAEYHEWRSSISRHSYVRLAVGHA
jgi:hypothetical protein